jgi:cysteine desulfurase
VAGIVGLGAAAEIARAHMTEEVARVAAMRDRLEDGILASVPFVAGNGDRSRRVPGTTNLTFDYIEGEGFVIAMDLRGIACSTGSACSSGSLEPSHVLTAIGLRPEQARASIRFSLGRFNTNDDVDAALKILPAVVEHLRAVSPHFKAGLGVRV